MFDFCELSFIEIEIKQGENTFFFILCICFILFYFVFIFPPNSLKVSVKCIPANRMGRRRRKSTNKKNVKNFSSISFVSTFLEQFFYFMLFCAMFHLQKYIKLKFNICSHSIPYTHYIDSYNRARIEHQQNWIYFGCTFTYFFHQLFLFLINFKCSSSFDFSWGGFVGGWVWHEADRDECESNINEKLKKTFLDFNLYFLHRFLLSFSIYFPTLHYLLPAGQKTLPCFEEMNVSSTALT